VNDDGVEREAAVFGRYILGRDVDQRAVALYARALAVCNAGWDQRDAGVVAFALRRPWALGALDGALALVRPRSLLRKKLLLMAAVLETVPEYADDFLAEQRPWWHALGIGVRLVRAAWSLLLGLVLLRTIR